MNRTAEHAHLLQTRGKLQAPKSRTKIAARRQRADSDLKENRALLSHPLMQSHTNEQRIDRTNRGAGAGEQRPRAGADRKVKTSSRSRKKVSPARHAPDRERTSGKDRPEMNQAEERQHCSALESKEIDLVHTDSKQICSPPLNRTRA
jgi:hypothetical protein